MNRLINSVLIGLVAFFGLLVAFTFMGLRGVDGDSNAKAQLEGIQVHWNDAGPGRTEATVTLFLRHPGTVPTRAVSLEHEATLDGVRFDHGTRSLEEALPAGKGSEVQFTALFGSDFAQRWYRSHAEGGHASTLAVTGRLTVQEGEATRVLPFEWTSTWRGDLGSILTPLQDCPQPGYAVCLKTTTATWNGAVLRAIVVLEGDDLRVGEGKLSIHLGGQAIAAGDLREVNPAPDGRTELVFDLRAQEAGLGAWWPEHVARCESSPAHAELVVGFEDRFGRDAGTATWQTDPDLFVTGFVCNGDAA